MAIPPKRRFLLDRLGSMLQSSGSRPCCPVAPFFPDVGKGFPFKFNQPKKDALFFPRASEKTLVSFRVARVIVYLSETAQRSGGAARHPCA